MTRKINRNYFRIFGMHRQVAGAAMACAIVLVAAVVATKPAQAQGYSFGVLYSFTRVPFPVTTPGPVVLDAQGNLYGTTSGGGASGVGTVFKVDTTGNMTVLYSFTGTGGDGSDPNGVVLDTQGNLYGTTHSGGASGVGTVFKVDTTGNETVLYSFAGEGDGAYPDAGVVLDAQGNLYGTTYGGGASGVGTVFKVDTTGNETVLYSFKGIPDAGYPEAGVVLDAQGNLYGTTWGGGEVGRGTVFKVDTTGQETVLHSFARGTVFGDGFAPKGGVVLDAQGNLYGTTYLGGYIPCNTPVGCGTVFKVDTTGQETVLHTFWGARDCYEPDSGLVLDAQGNLYGTCYQGPDDHSAGAVFKVDVTYGQDTILHSFSFSTLMGGSYPAAGVVLDAQGNLYGTATGGGANGWGTVFDLLTSAAATTTTLTSSPNPSVYARPVTFTAMVIGGAGPPPNGETVTFMNSKTVLGTGTLSGGTASFTTSTLKNGTTMVTALYGGDALFAGSTSNAVKQVVSRAATTTTLSSSQNPSTYGQAVTFTAVVTSVVGAPPDGETVSFMKGGTTVLGTGALSGGSAGFTTSSLPAGTNTITAVYSGDSTFVGSTSHAMEQVVSKVATTTALSSSPNPSTYGQAVTFTAVVTSSRGAPPDGDTVTFKEGTTALGTGSLSGGSASFTTSTLKVGTTSVKAVYDGDFDFLGSRSNTVGQLVEKYPTTTKLSSNLNPSNYGQAVTLTATVTSAGPTPTGRVTFRNGSATLGFGTLNTSGVAILTTAKIPVGTDSLTATYNGDAWNGKSGSAITQTVSQASISMVLTSTPNPSASGKSVKFTATLTSNGGLPSGQPVTFSYNGATLGTVNVNSYGLATFFTTTLPPGSDVVTAAYAGSVDYSSASATVTQVVN